MGGTQRGAEEPRGRDARTEATEEPSESFGLTLGCHFKATADWAINDDMLQLITDDMLQLITGTTGRRFSE